MITLHCQPPGEGAAEIRIGPGLRRRLAEWAGDRPTFALVDQGLLEQEPALVPAGWPRHAVAGGEAIKTLAGVETTLSAMVQAGLDRGGRLVALGGGSIGDAGGLCAALYLRGIELWMVPTTLLAMVDSSVGGKNAVNLPEGKNLAGTVHPPALVVIDLDFLATLPEIELRSGLGEVLKMAIGFDQDLFALLEHQRAAVLARDQTVMGEVVRRCVAAKVAVVEADLRESGPRRRLNLGHTLGHALEAHSGYALPHGLCVGRGLHFAAELAREQGALSDADAARVGDLLRSYGLGADPLPPVDQLMAFIARDKKVESGRLHFVLPTGIGSCAARPLDLAAIRAALARVVLDRT